MVRYAGALFGVALVACGPATRPDCSQLPLTPHVVNGDIAEIASSGCRSRPERSPLLIARAPC